MTRKTIYRYLGTNGIIESPVHLENIYSVHLAQLTADEGMKLSNGKELRKSVLVTEGEAEKEWKEVKA